FIHHQHNTPETTLSFLPRRRTSQFLLLNFTFPCFSTLSPAYSWQLEIRHLATLWWKILILSKIYSSFFLLAK
ncbi:unnamed protein product, partial [Prunus brigantina]